MKINFAPADVPLVRRIQTAAVLQWVFSFLALAPLCIILFFFLLFTRFWLISVLYAVWWYIDWDTPSRGGRKVPFLCQMRLWEYMRDYFPIKLVKTADLDPRKNYVLGFHPHGILVAGAFTSFCTEATGFSKLFPGLRTNLLMLPLWFRAPFFRDYIMAAGLVPSDKESASYLLRQKGGGNAVVIAVGGAPEALDAHPGDYTVHLANKKGFIKLAIEHGADLVPIYSFGENEVFDQVENPRGTWLRYIQERLQRIMGVSLPLFHARGVFQYSFGLMPYRKPINTVGSGSSILSALHDLPSVPWLTRSKIVKHLQVISVLQFVITFLAMGIGCSLLLMYMFCTDCWVIAAIYTAWLIYDWNTPKQGGRRSTWVRNWTVWKYFRDYFPIRLIKTHNLLPSRNYIFGYHPHGIFCFGAFCNFGTEATGFSKIFPGIKPSLATLAGNFRLPVFRDYLMSGGICPVNRNSIDYLLSSNGTGNAVVIVIGGAAESLDCAPGMNSVTLRNRKGFVKLALKQGADLVPVYSFGENEVYKQLIFDDDSWWRTVQKRLQKILGFAPCLFHGCGLFFRESWGLVPYCKPITTVVGEPITVPKIEEPTQDVIDMYHAMYIRSLKSLFDNYKTRFGLNESDTLHIQ
ncbi:diacylglycerol O-acyltransferase 2 [Labeo rohita]|uniref:Diacylglycerol O-acyltransferase 2 n=2 Tax=Labeo rohita TaxID=84645 RepID=A0A498L7M9_LABRO|nr:diacylglycerol O-acyltransferase 2 [Labeo rohita]